MITKEMKISEILDLNDGHCKLLESFGLNCCGCPGAASETLEEAAKGHGVDLQALLSVLNDRSAT